MQNNEKSNIAQLIKKSRTLSMLYVEDENSLRENGRSFLSNFFNSVDTAGDGEEGLGLFKSKNYDIVMTDINMPKMNGIEMAREIRKIAPDQEILILSALEKIEYSVEAINMGIGGIIQKPLEMNVFTSVLEKSVQRVIEHSSLKNRQPLSNNVAESLFFMDIISGVNSRRMLKEKLLKEDQKAILLLNIDSFSNYNSVYGLIVGDQMLKKVAEYLLLNLPDNALLYRWSGDEFVIVLDNPVKNQEEELARQIKAFFLETPLVLDSFENYITFTIGIDCGKGIELLKNVDIAVREARRYQNNTIRRYCNDSHTKERQLSNIEHIKMVRYAIENDMVIPYYQPIINSETGKIEKYECLARIKDGQKIIKAGNFLEVARVSGMLPAITKLVIDRSFKQFIDHKNEFSINISPEELLDSELVKYISKKTEQYKIDPARITLDIEYLKMNEHNQNIAKQLKELKSIGCSLALDSHGSKEIGLEYLFAPYIDYIILNNDMICCLKPIIYGVEEQNKIISRFIKYSKEEGKKIIAKHIDSVDMHDRVLQYQIEFAQGNLFYEPSSEIIHSADSA